MGIQILHKVISLIERIYLTIHIVNIFFMFLRVESFLAVVNKQSCADTQYNADKKLKIVFEIRISPEEEG